MYFRLHDEIAFRSELGVRGLCGSHRCQRSAKLANSIGVNSGERHEIRESVHPNTGRLLRTVWSRKTTG